VVLLPLGTRPTKVSVMVWTKILLGCAHMAANVQDMLIAKFSILKDFWFYRVTLLAGLSRDCGFLLNLKANAAFSIIGQRFVANYSMPPAPVPPLVYTIMQRPSVNKS